MGRRKKKSNAQQLPSAGAAAAAATAASGSGSGSGSATTSEAASSAAAAGKRKKYNSKKSSGVGGVAAGMISKTQRKKKAKQERRMKAKLEQQSQEKQKREERKQKEQVKEGAGNQNQDQNQNQSKKKKKKEKKKEAKRMKMAKGFGSKQVLASRFAPTFPTTQKTNLVMDASVRRQVSEAVQRAFSGPTEKGDRGDGNGGKGNSEDKEGKIEEKGGSPPEEGKGDAVMNDGECAGTEVGEGKDENGGKREREGRRLKEGVVVGVNEVTRKLEKGDVDMVVSCRDVSPMALIAHLPALCYVRGAALVIFQGEPRALGELVFGPSRKVSPVLAFAILKSKASDNNGSHHPFAQLISELSLFAVKLDFPWLRSPESTLEPFAFPFPAPLMIPHRSKKQRAVPTSVPIEHVTTTPPAPQLDKDKDGPGTQGGGDGDGEGNGRKTVPGVEDVVLMEIEKSAAI